MLSQTTEYALRIIVYLASLDGKSATTSQIASATRTPPGYLPKILRNLARGGLVRSQRGLHGGSVLTRPADRMSVWDVTEVVDPIKRIESCPLGLKDHAVSLCPLHHRLDMAIATLEAAFRTTSIAELVAKPSTAGARTNSPVDGIPTAPASGLVTLSILKTGTKSPSKNATKKDGPARRGAPVV